MPYPRAGIVVDVVKVLLFADEGALSDAVRAALSAPRFQITGHKSRRDAASWLGQGRYDVILLEAARPEPAAPFDLSPLSNVAVVAPTIILLSEFNAEATVEAVRRGAQDALPATEIHGGRLQSAIECAITRAQSVHHDSLTGLPNRALLNDRMSHAISHADRYGEQLAVMFFDLDKFKIVNDTLGHETGDTLLQMVAMRMNSCLRDSDTIARLGGDEFIAVIGNIAQPETAARIAKQVITRLSEPLRINGEDIPVSPSIGIAIYPSDGDNAEELIKCADAAMYQAKQQGGKNYMFYRPDMNADTIRRIGLAFALQRAIRSDEFELHYQPQFDLDEGRVIGVEALLRWHHPERGLIPPDQFIPLAEDLGLMVPMGDWVLENACSQLRRWRDGNLPPFRLAVNLSARQFYQEGLVGRVLKWLDKTGLTPDCLEIELTESSVMRDAEETRLALHELSDVGIRLSIDDFGTGYSSLSYLKRFPINALKIDRSFIHDVTTNPNDAALVRTIIGLAENLHLDVVAEGVETPEQLEFLRANNCRCVQGYLLGKPVPANLLPVLLADMQKIHGKQQPLPLTA